MADTFDPNEFSKYKAKAALDDTKGFDPTEFNDFKGSQPQAQSVDYVTPGIKSGLDTLKEALTGGLASAPDMATRTANYLMGRPNNVTPNTPLQAAFNRPDLVGTAEASLIPGTGLASSAARIAGSAGAAALSPDNKGINAATAGGLQTLLEALPYGAGKLAPGIKAIMSKASGVDAQAIQKLFDNPSLLFTGPSMQEARDLYAKTATKLGLSPEVSDNVLFQSGKKFVKGVVENVRAGEDTPTQTLLDARQAIDDLIDKAKRSGTANKVKGFVQRRNLIQDQIAQQAPELRTADQTFGQAATRNQFLSAVPTNANGSPSKLAMGLMGLGLGYGATHANPAAAGVGLMAAPIVQGLGISAAGAVSRNGPAVRTGLQLIRQYLANQRAKGPGAQ